MLAVIRLHVDDLGPADAAVELALGAPSVDGVPAVARCVSTAVQDVLAGSAGAQNGLTIRAACRGTGGPDLHGARSAVVVVAQQTGTVLAVVPVA